MARSCFDMVSAYMGLLVAPSHKCLPIWTSWIALASVGLSLQNICTHPDTFGFCINMHLEGPCRVRKAVCISIEKEFKNPRVFFVSVQMRTGMLPKK